MLLFPPDICGALVAILPTRAERLFENPVEGLMLLLLLAFVVVNGVADIDIDDDVGGDAIDRSGACQLLAVADGIQSSISMLFMSISHVISPTPAALL